MAAEKIEGIEERCRVAFPIRDEGLLGLGLFGDRRLLGTLDFLVSGEGAGGGFGAETFLGGLVLGLQALQTGSQGGVVSGENLGCAGIDLGRESAAVGFEPFGEFGPRPVAVFGDLVVFGIEARLGGEVRLGGFFAAGVEEEPGSAEGLGELSEGGLGLMTSDKVEEEGEDGECSGSECEFPPGRGMDFEVLENRHDRERREDDDECDRPGA